MNEKELTRIKRALVTKRMRVAIAVCRIWLIGKGRGWDTCFIKIMKFMQINILIFQADALISMTAPKFLTNK